MTDQHSEYRVCHLGGAVYLAVESALWLCSACLATIGHIPAAMIVLLFGGVFIHPVSRSMSRLLGLKTVSASNRLPVLSAWVALTIPLGLPLIFMATAGGKQEMFYPAFAVLVGAHWLPFAYIYSMKSFAVFAVILVSAGVVFGFLFRSSFSSCGFFVGGAHLVFAAVQYLHVRREREVAL